MEFYFTICSKTDDLIILTKFQKLEINRGVGSYQNLTVNILHTGNRKLLTRVPLQLGSSQKIDATFETLEEGSAKYGMHSIKLRSGNFQKINGNFSTPDEGFTNNTGSW